MEKDEKKGGRKEAQKTKKKRKKDAEEEDDGRLNDKHLAQALNRPAPPRSKATERGGKRTRREFSMNERKAGRRIKKRDMGAVHFK